MTAAEDRGLPDRAEVLRRAADRFIARTHLGDIPWSQAPIPDPVHECWAQTREIRHDDRFWLERCPCGGWRHIPVEQPTPWYSINSRAARCAPSPSLIMRALHRLRRKDTR